MTGFVTGSVALLGSQLLAPPGTRMTFHQANPPLGWVTDATLTDHAMRVVTGAGGGTGGSVNHSTLLNGGTFNLSVVSLTTTQMPAHNHSMSSDHSHGISSAVLANAGGGQLGSTDANQYRLLNTNGSGTGVSLQSNGSGTSFTPNITAPVLKFAAFIVAQKS